MNERWRAGNDELPDRIRPSELTKRLRPDEDEAIASLALKTLARRRGKHAFAQAMRIVGNRRFSIAVRAIAAVELGKSARGEHEASLLKALEAAEPELLRHAIRSLGRIGGEKSLDRLLALDVPDGYFAEEELRAARVLIAHRLGSTRVPLARPPDTELRPPSATEAMSLEVRSIGKAQLRREWESIVREMPGTVLSRSTGLAFSCGNSDYRVVLAAEIDDNAVGLMARPSIAGAILKYRVCSDRFSLDTYLLSSPRDDRSADVFGLRPSGMTVLAGTASLEGGTIGFELMTTRSPHYQKLQLIGNLTKARRLRIASAQVGRTLATERPPRAPRVRPEAQRASLQGRSET